MPHRLSLSRRFGPIRCLLTAATCIVLGGCGPEGPELAPVSGQVSYQGKPLADAQVLFLPEDGSRSAMGKTDSQGRFELGTLDPTDGAVVGMHRVSITARGPGKPAPPGDSATGLPGASLIPGDPRIPEKYFSPETSGLSKEVQAGSNEFQFDL